jgi:hypothetical protein
MVSQSGTRLDQLSYSIVCSRPVLPDFSLLILPKCEKYTERNQNIPNDNKIYQMPVNRPKNHKIHQQFPQQDHSKLTQNWDLG